eukprot:TRINITY_DN10451_c0_g1_i5.p2 TRINITY_DN10451_c0_g1~~TRINITY_DN10451_c0_g1_i5.p2  ORF type:complete len:101 (-),score=7.43 TRINITY_DN10451_c0_g1_i5:38-340(-)
MRRFAVAAILVFLANYPLIQFICLAVIIVIALTTIVRILPYKNKSELISQLIGEVISLLFIVMSLCLNYNESLSVETKYNLGSSVAVSYTHLTLPTICSV